MSQRTVTLTFCDPCEKAGRGDVPGEEILAFGRKYLLCPKDRKQLDAFVQFDNEFGLSINGKPRRIKNRTAAAITKTAAAATADKAATVTTTKPEAPAPKATEPKATKTKTTESGAKRRRRKPGQVEVPMSRCGEPDCGAEVKGVVQAKNMHTLKRHPGKSWRDIKWTDFSTTQKG